VTERYEPSQRTLAKRVTIDARLPASITRQISTGDGNQSVVLFPVAVLPKGEMVDNLRVLSADGAEVPILSYAECLQLTAKVIRTLLAIGYQRTAGLDNEQQAKEAEQSALHGITRRASDHRDPSHRDNPVLWDYSGRDALKRLAAELKGRNQAGSNPAAVYMAASLAESLTSHYPVVASLPCPPDGRLVVTYERLITPSLHLARRSDGVLNWVKARLRFLLGARPVDITVSLDNAWTAQSYHLFVDGQEGVFVGEQKSQALLGYFNAHWRRLVKKRSHSSPITEEEAPPPPYYRFRRRAGQRYAHFYSRFFPRPVESLEGGNRAPSVRFLFYEVPPGSMFKSVLSAVAAALLIWLIGFVVSRETDIGTDVPAFLLVVPALVAAWFGLERIPSRLLEGTLASRLSLIVTVLASICASGLYMLFKADLPYFRSEIPQGLDVLGISSLAWGVVTLVIILNAVTITYMYLARAWEFAHLATRPDPYESVRENVDRQHE
jgi:hypothetical protein